MRLKNNKNKSLIYALLLVCFCGINLFKTNDVCAADVPGNANNTDTLSYDAGSGKYLFSNGSSSIDTRNISDYVDEVEKNGTTPIELTITLKSGDSIVSVTDTSYGVTPISSIAPLESLDGSVIKYRITFKKLETTKKTLVGSNTSGNVLIKIKDGATSAVSEHELMVGYAIYKRYANLQASIANITYPEPYDVTWSCDNKTTTPWFYVDSLTGPLTLDGSYTYNSYAGSESPYTGHVMIDANDYYYDDEVEVLFYSYPGKSSISIPDDIKMGTISSVSPSATIVGNEGEEIVSSAYVDFYYKKKTDPDSAFTTEFPTSPGSYIVVGRFASYLTNFKEPTKNFTISYLTAPDLVLSGRAGSNGYYTSDVTLKAPSGYGISTTYGSGYVDSLEYKDVSSKANLYFKETSTGALSDKVSMPSIKIDKVIPVISGIKNSQTYYEASKDIVISDDNLDSATVNGKALTITDGKASTTLSANGGKTDYTVVAKDKAGLTVTYNVTLAVAWMEKGVIPTGSKVKLYKGTGYTLNVGKWKVSGDATVYNGGQVFVASDKELTFSAE